MNLVIDDAVELPVKKNTRRAVGRIMLKRLAMVRTV
jgi:small nuclear ribonucleoprotein (snRNP)-like protein